MAVTTVEADHAKVILSHLLDRVLAGEEVVIARAGRSVARLVSIDPTTARIAGSARGQLSMSDDFDAPLDDLADLS